MDCVGYILGKIFVMRSVRSFMVIGLHQCFYRPIGHQSDLHFGSHSPIHSLHRRQCQPCKLWLGVLLMDTSTLLRWNWGLNNQPFGL